MDMKEMAVRPLVVWNYLQVRKRVREATCDGLLLPNSALPTLKEVQAALQTFHTELKDRARRSSDFNVEEGVQHGSDLGNVRLHASDEITEEAMELVAEVEKDLSDAPLPNEDDHHNEGHEKEDGLHEKEGHTAAAKDDEGIKMDRIGVLNCATTGDAISEAAIGAVLDAMKVERDEKPCSEFKENGKHLMEAFWYLFPLGRGLEAFEGSIPTHRTKHLMQHFSNRFQRDAGLLFVLANQVQRHTVLRSVNAVVRQPRSEEFIELVNDPNFLQILMAARDKPNSKEGRKVLKLIMPLLATAARPVPWGAVERGSCIGKLIAMIRRFGPPSIFLTVKPDDVHNPLSYRLTVEHKTNTDFPAKCIAIEDFLKALEEGGDRFKVYGGNDFVTAGLDVEEHLQRQAAQNPASTSMTFDQVMRTVLSVLMGTPTTDEVLRSVPLRDRIPGMFGLGLASYTVVEETGNGCHHMHTLGFCGAMPALCSSAAKDAELFDALRRELNKQYVCELPLEVHVLDATRRALGGRMFRAQYHKLPAVLEDNEEVESTAEAGAEVDASLGSIGTHLPHMLHAAYTSLSHHKLPLILQHNHSSPPEMPPRL
jgi:hypothetical protein